MASEYYDADFDWEDVAAARSERCTGSGAPPLSDSARSMLEPEALRDAWEKHYVRHENRFFRPKRYLVKAFPPLGDMLNTPDTRRLVGEVGCGTGSALLPVFKFCKGMEAIMTDISKTAIDCLRAQVSTLEHEGGNNDKDCENTSHELSRRCASFVCDAVHDPLPFVENSLDALLLVFTLSAIAPEQHMNVLNKCVAALRPGGVLLFRDYGLFDMVQTRCELRVGTNHYFKQDGIQCYFFSREYFNDLLGKLDFRLVVQQAKYCTVRNVNRKNKQVIDRVFFNAILEKT